MQAEQPTSHNIILENKTKALISGVKEVTSFDDEEINLFTQLGELKIRGKNLSISEISVDSGKMNLSGTISAIIYGSERKIPKNIITKVFR